MDTQERRKQLRNTGFWAFFFSGICAISAGVIVSILQEKYDFSYGVSGTLLSVMSIGNMAASFAAGILPSKFGTRLTVALMCMGYTAGYLLMCFFGNIGILIAAFLLVGIAKGCALNTCTVLVGNNSDDRTKSMSLMHSFYAAGAMSCPFLITALSFVNRDLPMAGIAAAGALLWIIFMKAGLNERPSRNYAKKSRTDLSFLKTPGFWLLTGLIFCQNAGETSVTGWLVTYYKNNGILSGQLSTYTVTILWGATLAARLLIAFVFPIRDRFRALAVMGIGCTVFYLGLMRADTPLWAIGMLAAFACSMAGVNPLGIAGAGKLLDAVSLGFLLPAAGVGAIFMPWVIGLAADAVSLQFGMMLNLIPCAGIFVLSLIIRMRNQKKGTEAA